MRVRIPDDRKGAGDAVIGLLAPVTAEIRATASVVEGGVDMAGLFPVLWDAKETRLHYAQLSVGGQAVGPAVVLQPLLDPPYCVFINSQTFDPEFRPSRGIFSGIRAYQDQTVRLETSAGAIDIRLRPDQAPNTVWNFLELCRGGFYTDVQFHRIAAVNATNHAPFVIQGGDPIFGHAQAGAGEGGPGYVINLEPSALPHDFGVLSMARNKQQGNSAGSQFFICLSREGTAHLDGQFAAFAEAVSGAEVIRRIAETPTGPGDRPTQPVVIQRCQVVDAPPYGQGPSPVKSPPPTPIDR